jgi:hypothetical protein
MKLGGIVFLLIGIVVAGSSFFLMQKGQKMQLFMYTGIAMAVFGAIRSYTEQSEPKDRAEHRKQLEQQLPNSMLHNHQLPRVCGSCHTRNNPKANYCGHCGSRL